MELFVATQIAAYQRKRILETHFLRVCPENVYLCLQQRLLKLRPTPLSPHLVRVPYCPHDTKNGYDLVTQLRFQVAFLRFPLALPFLPILT